jgi:hypothetical protein
MQNLLTENRACQSTILISCLLAFPLASLAANHYVWCGASFNGDGTSFQNPAAAGQAGAFSDLPAKLIRGDIYLVAGSASCTYAAHTFNDSGNSTISIVKATATNSGSVSGWQSVFGTNNADWDTVSGSDIWVIKAGNYTFDGSYGTFGTAASYGFRLRNSGEINFVNMQGTLSSLSFSNMELDNVSISPIVSNGSYGIFANAGPLTGLTFSNGFIHDMKGTPFQMNNVINLTVSNSWIARTGSTASTHGQGVYINSQGNMTSSNLIFNYNIWQDIEGTAAIVAANGIVNNLNIYGNVFFQTKLAFPYFSGGLTWGISDGVIGDLGPGNAIVNSAIILNNTFSNISAVGVSGVFFSNPSANNIIQENNLFWNCQAVTLTTGGTGDSESYNTVLESIVHTNTWTCQGTGDSCPGSNGHAVSRASVASNLADVVTGASHGLTTGDSVLVVGAQVDSQHTCGIDTFYVYPTVAVLSPTEFTYPIATADATCQNGQGAVSKVTATMPFVSPGGANFQLISDTADPHLNDGVNSSLLLAANGFDVNGVTRGGAGHWDRGAYQFVGISPPTSLTVTTR